MKSSIILVIGIPEEEEKEERENEIFEKMMPKNFEKLKKDTKPQIQEAQSSKCGHGRLILNIKKRVRTKGKKIQGAK